MAPRGRLPPSLARADGAAPERNRPAGHGSGGKTSLGAASKQLSVPQGSLPMIRRQDNEGRPGPGLRRLLSSLSVCDLEPLVLGIASFPQRVVRLPGPRLGRPLAPVFTARPSRLCPCPSDPRPLPNNPRSPAEISPRNTACGKSHGRECLVANCSQK